MKNKLSQEINIVAFNNPYPPDLGGLIDVYYRIKQLRKAGFIIHLHTFNYDRKLDKEQLLKYCTTVKVYSRKKTFKNFLSLKPFIVKSRDNLDLLSALAGNHHPILFEGTHCCAFLNHPTLNQRFKIVRMHNIEGDYYQQLAKSESSVLKRIYYLTEAWKLKRFDKNLSSANAIATVSKEDTHHYLKINKNTLLIPSSHQYEKVITKLGKGDFALYHGNLSVPENEQAALYLIKEVFSVIKTKFVIAGKNPSSKLCDEVQKQAHISLISNPEQSEMNSLIENAHILVLPTFQGTGLKLKLLYSLFQGRFCLVNDQMLRGTSLGEFCNVANTPIALQEKLTELMQREFDASELKHRKQLEKSVYSNDRSANAWLNLLSTQTV